MNKISADHLAQKACVYIRQSTPGQVQNNLESQRSQYALVERARQLGWAEVDIIDEDLGCTASGIRRPGFERMLSAVCDGKIGAIFSIEASRLARTGRDWHTLLEFCGVVGVLLIDAEGIYDPRQINDRLVLGMKGTISEMEVATFRHRAQAALEQKAKRGELFRRVAVGYVRIGDDRIEKDPDERVRSAIDLVFSKFTELASARALYLWLCEQQIKLPTAAKGAGISRTIAWDAPRYHSLLSLLKNPIYAGAYAYGRSQRPCDLNKVASASCGGTIGVNSGQSSFPITTRATSVWRCTRTTRRCLQTMQTRKETSCADRSSAVMRCCQGFCAVAIAAASCWYNTLAPPSYAINAAMPAAIRKRPVASASVD